MLPTTNTLIHMLASIEDNPHQYQETKEAPSLPHPYKKELLSIPRTISSRQPSTNLKQTKKSKILFKIELKDLCASLAPRPQPSIYFSYLKNVFIAQFTK
ncbi:hypothetical protein S245_027460 [Arachis hypogaea]